MGSFGRRWTISGRTSENILELVPAETRTRTRTVSWPPPPAPHTHTYITTHAPQTLDANTGGGGGVLLWMNHRRLITRQQSEFPRDHVQITGILRAYYVLIIDAKCIVDVNVSAQQYECCVWTTRLYQSLRATRRWCGERIDSNIVWL